MDAAGPQPRDGEAAEQDAAALPGEAAAERDAAGMPGEAAEERDVAGMPVPDAQQALASHLESEQTS